MSNEFVFIDEDKVFNHTNIIKQDYGGTGFNTFTKGDIMYSNSDNILTKLNIGDDLSILSINNSMPSWEMINTIKANKLNKLFIDITDNNNEYGIDIFNTDFYQFNVTSIQSIITSSFSNLNSYKTTVNFSSTITNGLANFNNFSIINTNYNSYINYNIVHIERYTDSIDLYTDYIINNSDLIIKYNLTNDNNNENLHLSTKLLTQENTIKTSIRFTPINYIYTCVQNPENNLENNLENKNKILVYLDDDIDSSSIIPNDTSDFIIKDINTNQTYTISNVSYTSNYITLTIDISVLNLNNKSISLTYTKNTTDIKNANGSLTNLVNKYIINTFVISKSAGHYLIDGIRQKALVLNTNYTYKFYNSTGETTIFNIVDITNSNTDLLSTYTETQLYKKGLYINEVNKEITFKPTKSGTYYYYFNFTVEGSVIYVSNDAVTNEYINDFVNTTIPILTDTSIDADKRNIELYFDKSVHNINHIIQNEHFILNSGSSIINSSIITTFTYNDTTLTINFTQSYSDIISIQYNSDQQLFTFNNTNNNITNNTILVDYTRLNIQSIEIIDSTNTTDTYTDSTTIIILNPEKTYTFIITFNKSVQDLITYTTTLSDSNVVSGFGNGTGLLGTVDKSKYTITSFTTGTITSSYTITLTLNDVRDYFNNLIYANTIGFNVEGLSNESVFIGSMNTDNSGNGITYTWKCPIGVTSVCVLCIGGGGGGSWKEIGQEVNSNTFQMYKEYGGGGGGGGLAWRNNIQVTPGISYTVKVGDGGAKGIYEPGTNGGNSSFIDINTIVAYGGKGGYLSLTQAEGGLIGPTNSVSGGSGGKGSLHNSFQGNAPGGGAGGYEGNGGDGGGNWGWGSGMKGDSGSGGGGAGGGNRPFVSGGGTGIYGIGASGVDNGMGGSGGFVRQVSGYGYWSIVSGGEYGGGGGGGGSWNATTQSNATTIGGMGAVRIIWGNTREFPSTGTSSTQTILYGSTPPYIASGIRHASLTSISGSYGNISITTSNTRGPFALQSLNTIIDQSDSTYGTFETSNDYAIATGFSDKIHVFGLRTGAGQFFEEYDLSRLFTMSSSWNNTTNQKVHINGLDWDETVRIFHINYNSTTFASYQSNPFSTTVIQTSTGVAFTGADYNGTNGTNINTFMEYTDYYSNGEWEIKVPPTGILMFYLSNHKPAH